MSTSRPTPFHCARGLLGAALTVVLVTSCGSTGGDPGDGTGGSTGSGGASGNTASGGSTGSGGLTSSGGSTSSGGTTASGGNTSSGGSKGSGGNTASGGSTSSGGTTSIGGQGGKAGASGMAGAGGTTTGGTGLGGSTYRGGSDGRAGMGGAGGRPGTGSGGRGGSGAGGTPPPLKKFVGNIDTRGQMRSDFSMYWDQVSPENAGKWGSVEGTRNQMKWSGLDAIHTYAVQHNLPFKQHNFIWGSQQPSWLGGLSQAEQKAEVEEWIRLFCERYPDTQLIDVVNEPPPHTTPVYVAALGGAGSSGYDWIVQAFKWAHQYCPNAVLLLNDYNNIEYANDNAHTIDIVTRIKNAGAPIGGVGAQSHACASLSASTIQGYIDKIATQTGLPVYISEYDLNIADDNQQKNVMQSQFTMFWNDKNVKGITIWGYIVGATWVTNSGLMTSSGTMRPAMTWLMDFLGR
jgi:endo-1,4-beta-xylanase